jgi:hypothetical protein
MSYDMDPPPPPDRATGHKAKDLKGRNCVFLPRRLGHWDPRLNEETGVEETQPFVSCDVWTFDRSGVIDMSTGVRVSWWMPYAQLSEMLDHYIAAVPGEGTDGRSIILAPVTDPALREVAQSIIKEQMSGRASPAPADSGDESQRASGTEAAPRGDEPQQAVPSSSPAADAGSKGWTPPADTDDLLNQLDAMKGRELLGALSHYGLPMGGTVAEMRTRVREHLMEEPF